MQRLPCAHVPEVLGVQASQSGMMLASGEEKADVETAIEEGDEEEVSSCVVLTAGICVIVSGSEATGEAITGILVVAGALYAQGW